MNENSNVMNKNLNLLALLLVAFTMCQCTYDGFYRQELKKITDKAPSEKMRVLTIASKEDSISLRQKSREIDKPYIGTKTMKKLYSRMLATVTDTLNPGVGIAAPQIGINIEMIIVQRFDKDGKPFEVYYSPKIKEVIDSTCTGREGCLSVPGYWGNVERPALIAISYFDSTGEKVEEEVGGFTAVIFQHEIDHLNGVLYFDHIPQGYSALTKDE